jgi:hypothetical protein
MANLGAIGAGGSINSGSTSVVTLGPDELDHTGTELQAGIREIPTISDAPIGGSLGALDSLVGVLSAPLEGMTWQL